MFAPRHTSRDSLVPVPPRPVPPKVKVTPSQEEGKMEGKVRFVETTASKEEDRDGKDDLDLSDDDASGSQIMFAQMSKGARSMLSTNSLSPFSSTSSLDALPLDSLPYAAPPTETGLSDDENENETGEDQREGAGVDLQPMKRYMRNLTLRMSTEAIGDSAVEGKGKRRGGGGTIRLYHAMNKGQQRLSLDRKNENEIGGKNESENGSDSEGEEGVDNRAKENEQVSGDAWAEKRKKLGEAKKAEPVLVWKTLTPRQPSELISTASAQGSGSDTLLVRKKKEEMLRREFIDTEASYVQNLDTIVKVFLNPLKEMAAEEHRAIITAAQIDLIFARVVPLHLMHKELLQEFKKAEHSSVSFADAFFFFVPYLKLYTQYVNKHPSAIDMLLKLTRSNSRFRRFLDDCLNKTGMDVESFLILPIQRLPRYELLLTDLVKQTIHGSNPQEHVKLQSLLAQIKEINRAVEESRKREENMEKMFRIHKSLVFPSREVQLNLFDRVSRSFEREGQLQLCTKKRGDSYKFEYMFELRHIVPRADGPDVAAFGGDCVFGLVDQQSRLESDEDEDGYGDSNGDDDGDDDDEEDDFESSSDNQRSALLSGQITSASNGQEHEAQVLYLKAASLLDKVRWIEQLQQLCSRTWTRVNFVRSRAASGPVLPRRRASRKDGSMEALPRPERPAADEGGGKGEGEERVAVPPRPSVYRRVEMKVARIRRKSGEVALHLLHRDA